MVASQPAADGKGLLAWAKRGEIVGCSPVTEPGPEVFFAFGFDHDALAAELLREMGELL